MRVVLFCHSLLSDWNHGNAHFLRGVVTDLLRRGHEVRVFEPRDAWSVGNLVADHGESALDLARKAFPFIEPVRYHPQLLDLAEELADCALVLVHEWNEADLVRRIGEHRKRRGRYTLLFHDTHHRSVTQPSEIARFDLSGYDGVLAFGEAVRQRYVEQGWARRAWTWHEAADTATFQPRPRVTDDVDGHVTWIGNWGDDERTRELDEFLIEPAKALGLRGTVHGVRYPDDAKRKLIGGGLRYKGWLPNFRVPVEFARHLFTVHVPRRVYVERLPGVTTIRPFEALACAMPLICAPWHDVEALFTPGKDFLVASGGEDMRRHMRALTNDAALRRELAEHGRATVLARHTCAHRVDELLRIYMDLAAAGTGGTC
jgi:spore maturation protein CgeB